MQVCLDVWVELLYVISFEICMNENYVAFEMQQQHIDFEVQRE